MSHPELIRQLLCHRLPDCATLPDCAADRTHCRADYHIPASFAGFAGHFPGRPVLPAIVQLAMVRLLAGDMLGRACTLSVHNAKFLTPILPDADVRVEVSRATTSWKAAVLVRQQHAADFTIAARISFSPVLS